MSTYDTNPAATDHTTALQNAFSAAAAILTAGAAKVRIVLDSRQKYLVGGAVTAGANGQWAQIPLPFSQTVSGTIQLVGQPRGANDMLDLSWGMSGTVIESTLGSAPAFSASVGIASIFGGPASYFNTGTSPAYRGINGFSTIKFATQDITIRSAAPVIAGIDCGWVSGFHADGLLQFDTDQFANFPGGFTYNMGAVNVVTAPQAIPLITPFSLDYYGTWGDSIVVLGWLCGPVLGEYVHIRRLLGLCLPGALINVDASSQVSRIDQLTDWNCAYGIATTNPTSATPFSITTPAPGSLYPNTLSTPIEIGTWNVQYAVAGTAPPAAFRRVYDLMDANGLIPVDATFSGTTDAGTILGPATSSPIILGNGASTTGYHLRARIKNKLITVGSSVPAMPATTVAIRNPYARDSLAAITGGTVTAIKVNTVTMATATPATIMIPANAIISVTYSVAPSWNWQTT